MDVVSLFTYSSLFIISEFEFLLYRCIISERMNIVYFCKKTKICMIYFVGTK